MDRMRWYTRREMRSLFAGKTQLASRALLERGVQLFYGRYTGGASPQPKEHK